jgi:molybdopterin converting factor small subunit
MISIEVSLFATLQKNRFRRAVIELPDSADVTALLDQLEIAREAVGILVVNRKDAAVDQLLCHGDRVTIIPPIGGG